jgi:hypothetical protein
LNYLYFCLEFLNLKLTFCKSILKMKYSLVCLILFLTTLSFSQEKFTISGTISQNSSGEGMIGVRVVVKDLQGVGSISNEYGFYSITLTEGNYVLEYKFFGYETITETISLTSNITLNKEMVEEVTELEDVVITSRKADENVKSAQTGVDNLDMKQIAKVPVIFGEKDIIKTMQLKPGVKSGGDGSSGFFVRGGGSDQNLILLDEAPVYNASHLLGFFSTFNSDAIKNATIYKGTAPAQYGGRLSSVLDIRMNEGNSKKYNVSGGLGLISSRLNVEGPIVKDKGSFLISGRRTYADLFLKLSNQENLRSSSLYFYDLNTKLNYKVSDKDRIYLSGYFGRDKLGVTGFGLTWGNVTGTIRWNRIINSKLFSNTSFIASNYIYQIRIGSNGSEFSVNSTLQDYNLKQEFQYFPNSRNKIRFGINSMHHSIIPGQIEAGDDSGVNTNIQKPKLSLENAAYVSNEWVATDRLNVIYGLRATSFSLLGNGGEYFTYTQDGAVNSIDTYAQNKIITSYLNLEPRLNASYVYSKTASIKGAYARNVQNVHLVSNSTGDNPTDIWIPSSKNIAPEISDIVSLGWFKNFKDNKYEFSAETYYKVSQNQIDYRDGANVFANDLLEGELLFGDGRAYGVEVYFKKVSGNFTGWVSYTLSKAERRIDGINNDQWYNARQDRTHDISLVGIYDINKKLTVSATFIYYTGSAITLPSGKYYLDNQVQWLYTERNGGRMPDYHRLDVGVTWIRKQTAKYESSWNFSVFNAYGRENAYSLSFRENESKTGTEIVQTSLFKMIPSVTYNFKFL